MQKKIVSIVFIYCIFCIALSGYSQTNIVRKLKTDISLADNPKTKINKIFLLCDQGYSLHPDTLMLYSKMAEQMAIQNKWVMDEIKARYYFSAALTNKGLVDSSLKIADQCLNQLGGVKKYPVLYCNILNQKGRCFIRMNQYKEAIELAYLIIATAEEYKDELLQVKAKTLIGWAYLEMGQPKAALTWHLRALRTTSDSVLLEKYAILFANLATNYNGLGKIDSAFYYIKKGVSYSRKHENLFALSNSLAIESELFVKSGNPKFSEALLTEVVAIRKLIGDPFYIASDMSQLGYYYAHYGQPEKGIAICQEGIAIARKYKLDTKLFFLYNSLADNYMALGNTDKYAEVLKSIIALKDSVYEKNSANSLAELQTKYQLQKKENTIIQQKLDLVTKNYWLYGSIIFFVISILFTFFIFKNYKRRQKLTMEFRMTEEKRLNNMAIKEAEENERRRVAADLHDNLGAYAASIVANVDTIKNEQAFNANALNAIKELESNSQSIVSQLGDTIWALKRSAISLIAISDRVKLLLQKLNLSYVNIKMDVVENLETDMELTAIQGFHLFQIIQESVINALKHSNCTAIAVEFIAGKNWKVIIRDDGIGMSSNSSENYSGNGLHNINSRAKEAGFKVGWQKNIPTGTIIEIGATTN